MLAMLASWAWWAKWTSCSRCSRCSLHDQSDHDEHSQKYILHAYFSYLNKLMLTLDSLLRFSSRKSILSFFMFSRRTFKSLIFRRRDLLQNFRSKRIVMRLCENCSRLNKKCRVKNKSNKCIKCVRLDRRCDLSFSAVEWKRVKIKRDRVLHDFLDAHQKMFKINIKMQEAMIKAIRLQI